MGAPREPSGERIDELRSELLTLLGGFDGDGARTLLDAAVAARSPAALVADVLIPTMHEVGERWADGSWTVAQEHFASSVVEGRLQSLGRDPGDAEAPLALLACPGGERHDLPLHFCAVLLRERGWRSAILGADTPNDEIEFAARTIGPAAVVLAINNPGSAEPLLSCPRPEIEAPFWIGGAVAADLLAERIGARLLPAEMPAAMRFLADSG